MRLLALALLAALVPVPAHASTDVTVTLAVHARLTFPYDEPAFTASCAVTVPAGSTAADVLDQAAEDGCIEAWSGIDYGGSLGRYLTGIQKAGGADSTDARNVDTIRFVCGALEANPGGAVLYSFWGFSVDGAAAGTGVDGHTVAHGEGLDFHYIVDACPSALYFTYLALGQWPQPPCPKEGNALTDAVADLDV